MTASPIGMEPVVMETDRWDVIIDGPEIQLLESRYQGRVSEQEWEDVRDTAAAALAQCLRPTAAAGRKTGLAIGKVQSGKTLSYTALTALAIDNGYRITVVLAGTKNPLLEQNYARLCSDLGIPRPGVTPFKNPSPEDGEVVRSVLRGGAHALIVVLKQRKRLADVARLIDTSELRGYPTLILDDEGDEASLNTQFRTGRRSAIYDRILRLRDAANLHAYIAYTATPQANLLISGIDGLSPDFGLLIEPGEGHCGGSVFFGPDRDRYVRVVPDTPPAVGMPEGLKVAIATFLVGATIRHLREPGAWHSMLIHNSNLRVDHQRVKAAVDQLVQLWKQAFDLPDTDPAAADQLRLFRSAYDNLSATIKDPPPWEEVSQKLRDEIWLVETWMVNSLPRGRDPIGTPFRLNNNILVGGNMLGRGVTIEGLAVTYITRRAQQETNADTMEQRARWFGYKEAYLDLCRIFLTSQLRDDYTDLLEHEDDFWAALCRNERQGLSIRDWPRMLRLDLSVGLRPTRQAVASYRQFRGTGWDVQGKVIKNPSIAGQNVATTRAFFARYQTEVRRFGNVEHLVLPNCPTEEVIRDLLSQLNTDETDWEQAYTSEFLARLLLEGRLPALNVLLMAKGEIRERTQDKEGRVNPMQGRSPGRDPTDPDFYPGDQRIHDNQPQLQVHLLRVRGGDLKSPVETTALSLFIPPDPQFDLRYVVRD